MMMKALMFQTEFGSTIEVPYFLYDPFTEMYYINGAWITSEEAKITYAGKNATLC